MSWQKGLIHVRKPVFSKEYAFLENLVVPLRTVKTWVKAVVPKSSIEMHLLLCSLLSFLIVQGSAKPAIDRKRVVRAFNPHRNASAPDTPLQVGNGEFAFGVDITGLQTFKPFGTLSTWGWHNFSLPTTPNQTRMSGRSDSVGATAEFRAETKWLTRLHRAGLVDPWQTCQLQPTEPGGK
jgi:hypothetical protein